MAFLDNSGDIILDAVLTDTGRFRMARGDFRISKFALGDDEIDYSLYNKNHPSGSAYFDLEVLRTPLLEAFTNNTSTMKSKLLSITRTNLLFLPVLKLLNGGNTSFQDRDEIYKNSKLNSSTGGYVVAVDQPTENLLSEEVGKGIIRAKDETSVQRSPNSIIVERGLDTTKIPPGISMDASLMETQFIIQMDHRLGSLVANDGSTVPVSFIDDDQIASYYVSDSTAPNVVRGAGGAVPRVDNVPKTHPEGVNDDPSIHNISGPRDRLVHFKINPSINLRTSTFLFEKLGSLTSQSSIEGFGIGATNNIRIIDSIVRVTSATTAYSIDIPVRYAKKV